MTFTALTRTTLTSIGLATAAMAVPTMASAQDFIPDIQPLSAQETRSLPVELQSAPTTDAPLSETTIGADGVETITRTRRITRSAPYPQSVTQHVRQDGYDAQLPPLPRGHVQGQVHSHPTYAPSYAQQYAQTYAPGAQVFQREQWIAECERRTDGHSGKGKGGIIGGLLGAIAGGIIGNRVFDSERLGGTLLGVGVGGIGGALLGSLIGGGRNDRGEYDCGAALDAYLSQYAHGGTRIAARTIPAPTPVYAAPVYAAPAYSYAQPQYYYQPPQQITYVPVEYQQRQRVIVRETVREEVIPGARRTIPAPAPQPVAPQPAPRPIKGKPRLIKGN
ncbi:MAG: hypothetical protein ABJK59_11250 [Erythrobacter sp.]|uniref:hypothetical protein n=1 Tax=Erythrobacter sp. TaxID=1042 RepID=UPI0032984246